MAYKCSFCGQNYDEAWRCKDCGMIICDSCSKGGKSGALGGTARVVAGLYTAGLSEVARAGYRKLNQKCLKCNGDNLVLI